MRSRTVDTPEETAEAFAGGWFHSEDLASVAAAGYIPIADRTKDIFFVEAPPKSRAGKLLKRELKKRDERT